MDKKGKISKTDINKIKIMDKKAMRQTKWKGRKGKTLKRKLQSISINFK